MTTILAAFEDHHAAHRAAVELAHAGIPRSDLHVEHDVKRLRGRNLSRSIGNDSVLGTAGRMFADLVQTNVNHHQMDVVTEALERSGAVVIARTSQPALADRAVMLLRAHGAFTVGMQAPADAPH